MRSFILSCISILTMSCSSTVDIRNADFTQLNVENLDKKIIILQKGGLRISAHDVHIDANQITFLNELNEMGSIAMSNVKGIELNRWYRGVGGALGLGLVSGVATEVIIDSQESDSMADLETLDGKIAIWCIATGLGALLGYLFFCTDTIYFEGTQK